jgi:7,8-dihydropterin-6-yl-methyl-4-(beta-D-ribofuranosyl)aminobenzene 5'-phosphate synthase
MNRLKALQLTSLILFLFLFKAEAQDYKYLTKPVSGITAVNGISQVVTIKVIYDNYVKTDGLEPDWGYAILIQGLDKTILFDTGAKPDVFENNFKKMGLDANKVDYLILSHEHGDHTEGIPAFIKMKSGIPVVIPWSFSMAFKKKMTGYGLEPMLVKGPAEICTNLYTSGEFDFNIAEQSLILNTTKGLVVMTGCSHPGIVEMLKKIRTDFGKNIYMVFGGFHLLQKSEAEMKAIISGMKALGVEKCGATHCTGVPQIKMIRNAFGEGYFELGVGNTIIIN